MARERQRLQYIPHDVKHISHKHFEVTRLNDSPNGNFKLEISNIDLDDYDFPLDAELSVIIKQGSENLRTQEIGNVRKPEKDAFEDFGGVPITSRFVSSQPGRWHSKKSLTDASPPLRCLFLAIWMAFPRYSFAVLGKTDSPLPCVYVAPSPSAYCS